MSFNLSRDDFFLLSIKKNISHFLDFNCNIIYILSAANSNFKFESFYLQLIYLLYEYVYRSNVIISRSYKRLSDCSVTKNKSDNNRTIAKYWNTINFYSCVNT